jgi:hypothetical protein
MSDENLARFSHRWLFARRGSLRLTDRALEFEDWVIPYEELRDAVIYRAPSHTSAASILVISSPNGTYQFQLLSTSPFHYAIGTFWSTELPFHVRFEKLNFHDYFSDRNSIAFTLVMCTIVTNVLLFLAIWLKRFF